MTVSKRLSPAHFVSPPKFLFAQVQLEPLAEDRSMPNVPTTDCLKWKSSETKLQQVADSTLALDLSFKLLGVENSLVKRRRSRRLIQSVNPVFALTLTYRSVQSAILAAPSIVSFGFRNGGMMRGDDLQLLFCSLLPSFRPAASSWGHHGYFC